MGRRREGPRVDPATIAGVVAPVGWRRAGSSSPHLRAFAIGLARRPSAQRRVRARFVVEAGITLRKFLWDNDLATRCGLRVSHGVSEGRKSRYPPGLRDKHTETERSGGSEAPIPPPQRPSERRSQVPRRRGSDATRGFRPVPRPRQTERRLSEAVRADFSAPGDPYPAQVPSAVRVGGAKGR